MTYEYRIIRINRLFYVQRKACLIWKYHCNSSVFGDEFFIFCPYSMWAHSDKSEALKELDALFNRDLANWCRRTTGGKTVVYHRKIDTQTLTPVIIEDEPPL